VPTAASIAGGATVGPRVLPGTYTVKLTKDTAVYTMQLPVAPDPRAHYTDADRQAALALAMRISATLADMTYTVDRMNAVRLGLDARARQLPAKDALIARLTAASGAVDDLRKKIVATKEGGMITGEQRLREYITDLYGGVIFYDGPPSATELQNADALARELADVTKEFDTWLSQTLPGINAALTKKKLDQVQVMTRAQWDAANAATH
jgi:hypothetical protein